MHGYLVLVIKFHPTRDEGGIEKLKTQRRMSLYQGDTCSKSVRGGLPQELSRKLLEPFVPIFPNFNTTNIPRLFQMLLIDS
jgi:hypothetical protein